MSEHQPRDVAALEVVDRTRELADRHMIARLLALALIVEHDGALILTRRGKQTLRAAADQTDQTDGR